MSLSIVHFQSKTGPRSLLGLWVTVTVLALPIAVNGKGLEAECSLRETGPPLAVVLLAGQSNMAGLGDRRRLPPESAADLLLAGSNVLLSAPPLLETDWAPLGFGFGLQDQVLLDAALPGTLKDDLFGPELGFGLTMAAVDGGAVQLGIVKHARPGTDLAHDWRAAEGAEYLVLLRRATEAINALEHRFAVTLKAVVWMQGESDADAGQRGNAAGEHAAAYAENLEALIRTLRRDLYQRNCIKDTNLPFVIGRISNSHVWEYAARVRKAQLSVAKQVPRVAIVDTDSLELQDDVHYTTMATLQLGALFASAVQEWPAVPGNRIAFGKDHFLLTESDGYCLLPQTVGGGAFAFPGVIPWNLHYSGQCAVEH